MEEFYNLCDEDEQEDALLNSAMDRCEQMGGALRGPLFQFKLQKIGKRRTWREVVQRENFNAQLQQLRDPVEGDDIGLALTEALYRAIETELNRQQRPPHHFVNLAIMANGFAHAYQTVNFTVGKFLERSVRLDEMLATLADKLNSNESFDPQQGFQVDIVFVSMPTPGRGKKKYNVGRRCMERDNKFKRSIIPIKNKDDLCCARAIVTMIAHCHKDNRHHMARSNWEACRKNQPRQGKMAKELHREAGVPEGPCGLEELAKFQTHLSSLSPNYQLRVMCRSSLCLIFEGPPAPHQIKLLKSNSHYDGCTSFQGVVNRSYWCDLCKKGYDHEDAKNHPCEGRICKACGRKDGCPDYRIGTTPHLLCEQCNGRFYGPQCKQYHVTQKLCQNFKHCLKCCAEYKVIKGKPHRCGYRPCPSCKERVELRTHRCFIQPIVDEPTPPEEDEEDENKKAPLEPLFVYADIEAQQLADRSFEVNLLCYRHHEEETIHSLWGIEGCLDFLKELDELTVVPEDDRERPIIVIFHNLKGFDGMFIIEQLYKEARVVEKQMTVGAKVLCFKSGPITFKDSLCFLPMPLAAFTATFNLQELKKGYFPHQFNTPEHQEYVGPIPALHYYDPDSLDTKKKKALETWHAEQVRRGVVFDFKKELEEYCQSDVALLQGGCEAFCKEFEEHAGFNPFAKCVTIAAACNLYWRKHHLPHDTIAVRPLHGWRGAQVNHSLKALQWLYYEEQRLPKDEACADRIKHVRNGGEQTVVTDTDSYFVDGYDPMTRTVYEFHGCLWHGCKRCFPRDRQTKHPVNPDRTLDELLRATQVKAQTLRTAGYRVVELWEHEWDAMVKDNLEVQLFLAQLELVEPLEPRDAFFGGRTGAVSLYAKAQENEEIRYIDVTSLYPWVNKTQEYPTGHPVIMTQPTDQSLDSYFGIAKVDIVPPAELFHPVLPVRSGGKLTFPLCGQCVQDQQQQPMLERTCICPHTDEQRTLRGTWCTPELQKAIEVGYRLVRIHEVWHFPAEQRRTGAV